MVQLLDNSMINVEVFPGKKDQNGQPQPKGGEAGASAKSTADATKEKAEGAVDTAKETADSTSSTAEDKLQSTIDTAKETTNSTAASAQDEMSASQPDASSTSSTWSQTAQDKAAGLQSQAGEYQSSAASTIKGYGDTAEQQGNAYVQSGADYANTTAKQNLPMSMHGYTGAAVDYASNVATGTVGTVGGGLKDVGDTVGNAGYQTVAGVGKTGWNLGSGIGGAVMGKKGEGEAGETVEGETAAAETATESKT